MPRTFPLRFLIYLAFAQTLLTAVVLLAQKAPQPQVGSGIQDQTGGTYTVPLAAFLVMAISIAAGYCLVLNGAIRVRAAAGLPIAAAVTATLAYVPAYTLKDGGAGGEVPLRWAQLGVLAAGAAWALLSAAVRYRSRRAGDDQASPRWYGLAVMPAIVVAYYALEFGVWGSYIGSGHAAAGATRLRSDLSYPAVLLPIFLALIVLWGSTDLLGTGQATVRWAVNCVNGWLVKRVNVRLFLVLTPLAALAMVADVLQRAPGAVPLELAAGAVLAVIVGVLARTGRGYALWSENIRSRAVLLGSIAIFACTTVLSNVASGTGSLLGLGALHDNQVYQLVSIPVLLAALGAGIYLLLSGLLPKQMTVDLFLVTAGVILLIAALPAFLRASHLPAVFPHGFMLLSGVQFAAAVGVLAWAGWLLSRKQARPPEREHPAGEFFVSAFLLLAGLALVSLVLYLLKEITTLGANSAFALAGLFLLLGFWGLATSGDKLNEGSAPYPRDGRIMLFTGYTLIANASLLYLGTLHLPGTNVPAADYLTSDYVTPAGVGILGTSVVVLAFVLRPREGQREKPAGRPREGQREKPRHHSPNQAARLTVAGVAAALTALVVVFVAVTAWPQQARSNAEMLNQAYRAPVPGPGCDTNQNVASWSVPPDEPVSARCLRTGLLVVAAPRGAGDVQFLPPSGIFPQNYSVSVHVDLAGLGQGCVSIYTRATSAGHYSSGICSPGPAEARTWGIQRVGPGGRQWMLGFGTLGTSASYTLAASAEGADQQIIVDDETASGTDATFPGTRFIALGVTNASTRAVSVVFSDFRFTPLPSSPRPCCAGTGALPVSTRDRTLVWFNNFGSAELHLLTARVDAVGLASGRAARGRACAELAAAVAAARGDPPVPDPAAQQFLAGALAELGRSAADCTAGAATGNGALMREAEAATRAAGADLARMNEAIRND
ncbi:MAG: hypothetical protein JOY82_19530 [Streptosporangiaceae bacterium]|nr:hypothetical protein [Streptosporangiaceae bacterium]MBV9856678.1 hypothetical protein [Streptosporangiaceae bacterium]